jgi:hypothetical protein
MKTMLLITHDPEELPSDRLAAILLDYAAVSKAEAFPITRK